MGVFTEAKSLEGLKVLRAAGRIDRGPKRLAAEGNSPTTCKNLPKGVNLLCKGANLENFFNQLTAEAASYL